MLKEEDKKRLQERFQEEASDVYQPFSKELFKQYSVKRGLRNDDGTGVMAGHHRPAAPLEDADFHRVCL